MKKDKFLKEWFIVRNVVDMDYLVIVHYDYLDNAIDWFKSNFDVSKFVMYHLTNHGSVARYGNSEVL